MRIVVFYLYYC